MYDDDLDGTEGEGWRLELLLRLDAKKSISLLYP